jgi:prophage regulatory protein
MNGSNQDIVARLLIDPGMRTLGELLTDRGAALHEILRLRSEIQRLRMVKTTPAPAVTQQAHARLMTLREVCELLSVSRSSVYKWVSEDRFPEPLRIGERAVRWQRDDVVNWRDAKHNPSRPQSG